MRWDGLISGLESLWESEEDNAEVDERREILRAERARTPFVRVLVERSARKPVVANVEGLTLLVHVETVGASWIEGSVCSSGDTIVIPVSGVQCIREVGVCGCPTRAADRFEHVTLGSRLRVLERHGSAVTILIHNGGLRGRVSAVWKDAVDITAGDVTNTVALHSIRAFIVERS